MRLGRVRRETSVRPYGPIRAPGRKCRSMAYEALVRARRGGQQARPVGMALDVAETLATAFSSARASTTRSAPTGMAVSESWDASEGRSAATETEERGGLAA